MPLHGRHSSRTASIAEPVFAAGDTRKSLPAHRFPDAEARSQDVFQLIRDELLLDGNARQNLATFCQTWEEPEVHRLMELAIDKNIIDKDEYPQSAEIEGRCVRLLADLWNAPDTADSIGTSTIGSSEACMLGGIAALWRWRAQRRAAGKPVDKPNMVCGPVQICWHKFARYWDVELREVPMEPRHLCLGPAEVASRVDENTIVVVPTFGVTYTGQYEPVAEIAGALDDVHARRGLDVPLHVDAASGGFLAPFCAPEVVFDFRLPRVKSISTSGHKFGLAPLGVGWIVWRTFSDLPRELIFSVDYLGGDMPTFALNFSRPAGQVIAQYYNFVRLGRAGDRAVHEACYATAHYLADAIAQLGPFDVIANGDPKTSIPAVCWKLRDSVIPGYTLYDLADRLRVRGWQVPAYPLAGNAAHIVVQRILVRQGLSRDLASLLLDDLRSAIGHFGKHPVSVPMSAKESGGFKHT